MGDYSRSSNACEFAGVPSNRQGRGLPHRRPGTVAAAAAADAAGMRTGRITELNQHTRKRTDWLHRKGRESAAFSLCVDEGSSAAAAAAAAAQPPVLQKKSQLRHCGVNVEEQRRHFQTRWKPVEGKMAFCTGRREGSAAVECDYDFIDRDNTYHTWKRMNEGQRHTGSHLQFDRFLTVEESAGRSDRLPEVHNRNPPLPNLDGPFERPRPHGGNLDRTFMPREDAKRSDDYIQKNKKSVSSKSSHLQLSTLHNVTGVDFGEMRHGLKRHPCEDHAFDFVYPPLCLLSS
uniref:Uncharacterized protein n=1 Tax=Eimeria tenella TaxID=5802 RepID=H9B9U2_EIMTE|nr:hypothetical protein [Eimeria tenella]